LTEDDNSEEEKLGTIDENVQIKKVPAMANYFFINQIPTRVVPPQDDKFHEFNVSLYNMCYDMEEKDEEKKSVFSSVILGPSVMNLRLESESPVDSARMFNERFADKKVTEPPALNLGYLASSMKAHDSFSGPKSMIDQNQHFFRKNPLLPPSPVAKDSNFVLKSKIRDLITHTEMLYQKMMSEKAKSNKKYSSN
jgi:hypothetical protein